MSNTTGSTLAQKPTSSAPQQFTRLLSELLSQHGLDQCEAQDAAIASTSAPPLDIQKLLLVLGQRINPSVHVPQDAIQTQAAKGGNWPPEYAVACLAKANELFGKSVFIKTSQTTKNWETTVWLCDIQAEHIVEKSRQIARWVFW